MTENYSALLWSCLRLQKKGWESRCTYVEYNTKDVLFFLTASAKLLKLQKGAIRKTKKWKKSNHHIISKTVGEKSQLAGLHL